MKSIIGSISKNIQQISIEIILNELNQFTCNRVEDGRIAFDIGCGRVHDGW